MQICEAQGKEPDEKILFAYRMEDFPLELNYAFFIYDILPSMLQGMGDYYAGKDITAIESLLRIYEVENPKTVVELILYINKVEKDMVNKRIQRDRKKAESAKNKGS